MMRVTSLLLVLILGCSAEKPEFVPVDRETEIPITSGEILKAHQLLHSDVLQEQFKGLQYVAHFPDLIESWEDRIKDLKEKGLHPAVRKKAEEILR